MNIRETEKKATFKGSFLNMEKTHIDYFIDSFKKKNAAPYIDSVLKNLPADDVAEITKLSENKEITDDLAKVFFWFINTHRSETIPEFLINFEKRNHEAQGNFPEISNVENIQKAAELFIRLYTSGKLLRQKLVQRSQIYRDFDIDKETLNDWLSYFELEKYHGQREFYTREYTEIRLAFTYVEGLNLETFKNYHFRGMDKLTIGKIIVGDSKSNQTVYRKLQKVTDEIDDLNPDNRKLIEWVCSHRKIPFSVAHRWVTLLLEAQNNPKAINALEVFEEYFSQK